MIEAGVSCRVDKVICERLAEMMSAVISWMLSESFQDLLETYSIIGNVVDSALARSVERGHLGGRVRENLTRTVDT